VTLQGKIALVAGATRGAGRGIARALGEAGATVYCTGRSSREGSSDPKRPETIEQTAEQVTAAGGTGIAVRVDHTDEGAVAQLFARVRAEHGKLDILVNDIWGGDPLTEWNSPRSGSPRRATVGPFWAQPAAALLPFSMTAESSRRRAAPLPR
jgi:NAD(P)-dependent dehydrogenase (short-subunit alcohol dehydrogenase family)